MKLGHKAVSDLLEIIKAWAGGVWIRLRLSGSKAYAHTRYSALLSWDQSEETEAKENLYRESPGVAGRAQGKDLGLRNNYNRSLQGL